MSLDQFDNVTTPSQGYEKTDIHAKPIAITTLNLSFHFDGTEGKCMIIQAHGPDAVQWVNNINYYIKSIAEELNK